MANINLGLPLVDLCNFHLYKCSIKCTEYNTDSTNLQDDREPR